jgi:hypothetical protein
MDISRVGQTVKKTINTIEKEKDGYLKKKGNNKGVLV